MTVVIRRFTAADYEAFVAVLNKNYPEHATNAYEKRYEDESHDEKTRWGRFLAYAGKTAVGAASFSQNPWTYHPRKFDIAVDVERDWRRQGIGAALFRKLVEELEPSDPMTLRCRAREDSVGGIALLTGLGFVEEDRTQEMRLDPTRCDPAAFGAVEERLRGEGVEFATMSELMAGDPDYQRKMFELDWEASSGVIQAQEVTRPTLEFYVRAVFEDPKALPEAWFVALHNGRYVGVSSLKGGPAGTHALEVEFTGVAPDYRRRGIALALKVRTIAYAQAHGNPMLTTWSNSKNQPMLALNEKLGFRTQPAWIDFRLDL